MHYTYMYVRMVKLNSNYLPENTSLRGGGGQNVVATLQIITGTVNSVLFRLTEEPPYI